MDRINDLPDDIVCHTLSFLSTKEAALTSVLSKRWRNLFAFTGNLRFEEKDFVYRNSDFEIPTSFIDFLDRALAVSGNSPIKKFSPKFQNGIDSAHINHWICNVLSRGVLHSLHLDVVARGQTSLPLEIFTCKTLVILKLQRGFVIDTVPKNASLPALKILFLDQIKFSANQGCAFETLVSACPVLEELTILAKRLKNWNWWNWYGTVSCPNLERLTISCCDVSDDFDEESDLGSITFDTPNLSYLDYNGFVPDECPVINLNSCIEAKLTLVLNGDPTSLMKGLRNVNSLNLSTRETSDILYSFHDEIPVLKNLSRLSIGTGTVSCWKLLPVLVNQSPNLETLIIKSPLQYNRNFLYNVVHGESGSVCNCLSDYSFLLSCPVRVLKLTEYTGSVGELEQIKHFLEKLSCLELLEVCAWATNEEAKLQLTTDLLLMLPGACNIKFEFIP